MSKGAIELALENRKARINAAGAIAEREKALAKLKKLNIEMEENCLPHDFEFFGMTVLDSPDLQNALSHAAESQIRVIVTNGASRVEGENIFIYYNSTDREAYNFLRGIIFE